MKKTSRKDEKKALPEEVAHYTAVLVEGLRSDFKMVIEKVDTMEESLIQRMDEKLAERDERFDRIEMTLQSHSRMFQQIEGKLDRFIEKVERHDQEIESLKTA